MVKIAVIYGSVRESRLGLRCAKFIISKLQERGVEAVLVDPMEHKLPLLNKMHKEYPQGEAPQAMQAIHDILESSDGYVMVSAEYNHGVPAALKNLLDHFQPEYFFKPASIVTYSVGGLGGSRAALHLRDILPELGMVSIPSLFAMSKIHESFNEEGSALDEKYNKRAKKILDEFLWYVDALKKKREEGLPY